jgi:pyruvate-formate lyase
MQLNTEELKSKMAAQQQPETHQDLVVRVAGYSACFVDLSKGLQDSIIARTEQEFG